MSFAIHLEDTLKKAEGILLQLKDSKKLTPGVKEILGLEITPCNSESSSNKTTPLGTPVINRESTPNLEIPVITSIKENGHSLPNSRSSSPAVTTPDDSSIEILGTENGAETGINLVYN